MDCTTPQPAPTATPWGVGCGDAVIDEARAELINPVNLHREAAYRACDGLTQAQVDGMIWKTIGEIADHEGNQG
ncbi:hypothetical protein ABT255_42385 [Streptomyces mirabilis]|uniref:hypothetical protein n=1 Tax=Streptomyces mirabilis TaxID=68239 RepID=UPI0033168DF7